MKPMKKIARFQVTSRTNGPPCRETHQAHTNQSSDILQHSQNRPTGDRWLKIDQKKSKLAAVKIIHRSESFELAEKVYMKLERFVCQLYGKTSRDINDLCHKLFFAKGLLSQQFPPARDALRKHTRRAKYQAAIWKRSLESHLEIPCSAENGWKLVNKQLKIDWNDLHQMQCWNFLVA